MTYNSLEEAIADPLFARTDLDLRRGRHIGADYDPSIYDFISSAKPLLDRFYAGYQMTLLGREEGYFYLLPSRLATPPPLGRRHLSAMDMLVGQTLALMSLDPKWLESNLRIPDKAVLARLEQILGEEALLRLVPRRRGSNIDQDARKLREAFAASLRSLERQCFIKREGRGEAGVLKPLTAIIRFADPVRTSSDLNMALERLVAEGQISEGDEGDTELDTEKD